MAADPKQLAHILGLIAVVLVRDVADPEVAAIAAALTKVLATKSPAALAALAALVVARVHKDETDPQVQEILAALKALVPA